MFSDISRQCEPRSAESVGIRAVKEGARNLRCFWLALLQAVGCIKEARDGGGPGRGGDKDRGERSSCGRVYGT